MSVLERRLRRAVRPKDRLWATIRLAEKLAGKDSTQTEQALTLFTEAERLAESIHDRRGLAAAISGAGSCQYNLSNLTPALELLERALPIAEQAGDAEREIVILRDIANVYERQGRLDVALQVFQKCIGLTEFVEDRVQATVLNEMGSTLMELGRYHESLECHTKSLSIMEYAGTARDQAIVLVNLSHPLLHLGRYADALSALKRANQLGRDIQDTRIEGACQGNIGMIYSNIGDYSNALASLFASATILMRIGDKLNLARAYGNVMNVHLQLGNAEQAANFGEEAIALMEEIDDKSGQIAMAALLGEYYLKQGKGIRAKRLLKKCLLLSKEIGLKEYETETLTILATLEMGLGHFKKSEQLFHQGLTIANDAGDKNNTVAPLLGLGSLFHKQGQPDHAFPFLERAAIVASEIHSRHQEQEAHQLLSEVFEAKGDFERALGHSKSAFDIKEEILGTEKQKAIGELQLRWDIEKSEQETARLRKESEATSREIEQLGAEMELMMLAIAGKNELIRGVNRRVRKILRQTGSGNRDPGSGKSNFRISDPGPRIPDPGQEFQLIHQDLLQKLSQDYPNLTTTERKICMLLRDGLSIKEMAGVMKVAPSAIGNYRYAIRKKMKLDRGTNLTTVLERM